MVSDRWVGELWGSNNFGYAQKEANGRSGGILLIWDTSIFKAKQAMGWENFVAVKGKWIWGNSDDVVIVNVYGPHSEKKKVALWKKVRTISVFNNCRLGNVWGF